MAKTFDEVFAERNNKPRPVEIAGYPCLVTRESLNACLIAGRVPQDLADELIENSPGETDAQADAEIDRREAFQLGMRRWRLMIELCVTTDAGVPFSFEREPGKICVFDLESPDLFIAQAKEAITAAPIQTAQGEVSAAALTSFRADGNGTAQSVGAGVHG